MKYMILAYGSQQDYDALVGRPDPGRPAWSAADFAAMGAFMEKFSKELAESGELVETRGLTAPVHARRVQLDHGVTVVTDGPYAETQEVLAGYWDRRVRELRPRRRDRGPAVGLPRTSRGRRGPCAVRGRTADRRLPGRAGVLTVHAGP